MKKLFHLLLIVFAFLFSFSIAGAATVYPTAYDLVVSWEEEYPEYVSGVWCHGSLSHIVIGIVNNEAGQAGRKEILSQISDKATVSFETQKYSYNELLKIQEELYEFFQKDVGLRSTAVMVMENRVELGMDLKNPTEKMQEFMKHCSETYGDAVSFVECGEIILYTQLCTQYHAPVSSPKSVFSTHLLLFPLVFLAGGMVCIGIYRRKRRLVPVQGNISQSVSESCLRKKIQESGISPSAQTDEKILSSIFKE